MIPPPSTLPKGIPIAGRGGGGLGALPGNGIKGFQRVATPAIAEAAEPLVPLIIRNPYLLAGAALVILAALLWGYLNQRGTRTTGERAAGERLVSPAEMLTITKTRTDVYSDTFYCGSDPPYLAASGGTVTSSDTTSAMVSSVTFGRTEATVNYICGSPYRFEPVGPQDGYALIVKDNYGAVIDITPSPNSANGYNDTSYASPYKKTKIGIKVTRANGEEVFPEPVTVDPFAFVPPAPKREDPLAPPTWWPTPLPTPLVAPPEFEPLVQPAPSPLPDLSPMPGISPRPGTAPAPSTLPVVAPVVRPAPAPLPVPGRVPGVLPDGTPAPITPTPPGPLVTPYQQGQPVPQTAPDAHVVGDLVIPSNPPQATPQGTATALGLIEAKAALALGSGAGMGGLGAVLGKLQDLLDFLNSFYGPGQYELQPPCGTKPDGSPLDPAVAAWPGGRGSDSLVQSKLDAIAQLLQYHKDQRQPICKGAPPIGSEVTVNFVEVP